MSDLLGPASRQQAMSHLQSFRNRQLPDLLDTNYGEWAVLDAATGELIAVRPAPEAFALAYERADGEVLLDQICKPLPMTAGTAEVGPLVDV